LDNFFLTCMLLAWVQNLIFVSFSNWQEHCYIFYCT
jgi:hypothetical protein